MRSIPGISVLLLAAAVNAVAGSNLKVVVTNSAGAPIASAQVAAIAFNNGQPSATASQIGQTDAAGVLNFDGTGTAGILTTGSVYQIVATSQAFLPAIIDQFPTAPTLTASAPSVTTPTITIVINPAPAGTVGEIDANVTNASPNSRLFGQIGLQAGGGAAAFGIANIDGAGAGTFKFLNVAVAGPATYQISAFDAIKNTSAGSPVNPAISATPPFPPFALGGPLNFANAAPPVANIAATASAPSAGGISVYGTVVDTATPPNPIPYIPLNFQSQFKDSYNQTYNDWRGAQSDQNGVFQLYDLRPGSTYYTTVFGGCNYNTNVCYAGSASTVTAGAAPGINDFLYVSSSVVLKPQIIMKQLPASTGVMTVCVKDQFGNTFPQAGININPEGTAWQTAGGATCNGTYIQNPGFKNANFQTGGNGCATVTGLPSGNYHINSWTPYGQTDFNAGADKQFFYGPPCGGSAPGSAANPPAADDLRVTIDTMAVSGMVGVYDIYGRIVSSGATNLNVTVQVATGATGVVQGVLTFPSAVDLSLSPISIILYPQCSPGSPCNGGGGFKAFSSPTTPASLAYSIPVSSGQSYYLEVISDFWGAVFPGGNQFQPNLIKSTYSVANIQFLPAGRITGFLRKPDGSVYLPVSGSGGGNPYINAQGNNSWGFTQLNNDGSFTVGGLLPGDYTLASQAGGASAFPYVTKQPSPTTTVIANQTFSQDLQLADAVFVRPIASTTTLPPLSVVNCPPFAHGDCPPENYIAYALPQGTPFIASTIENLLTGGGDVPGSFSLSLSTGQTSYDNGCNGQFLTAPGFCYKGLAATKAGSAYDFYLLRKGGFDSAGFAGGVRPYFVVQTSTKNIVISPAAAASGPSSGIAFNPYGGPGGSTSTLQTVNLTPVPSLNAVPQAALKGTVTVSNLINARQFSLLAGKFDNFIAYLPIVFAYDSSGTLKGVGLVTPFPPTLQANANAFEIQLNKSVASGDYASFQTLIGPAPAGWGAVGYDIRGLTAGTTYNLIVTTPNYPPFKTVVQLGVAGSTTTVDINMDGNPGTSISGLVKTAAGAALAGAQVTVKASGYAPTTVLTDSAGAWSLGGLGAGNFDILVVAAGYAQGSASVAVDGKNPTVVPTFSLTLANASITGTVYTNNPVCPAGVTCSAFGKTVLQGITVLAYDDTLNAANPTAKLPVYRAVTNSSGIYTLSGLVTGDALGVHSYKVFVNAPGYFVLNQAANAVVGTLTGFDFKLSPKPLDVNVFGHIVGTNYEFQITNYKSFSSGKAYISAAPFGGILAAGTTDVSTVPGFVQRVDAQGNQQLFLAYPLANLVSGTQYVLHLEAKPNDPRAPLVIKEVPFGQNLAHGVCQSIDQALIGDDSGVNNQGIANNEVPLDITGGSGGDNSGLSLPAGGLIPILSTAIPSMCMSQTDTSSQTLAGLSSGTFAGSVYSVTLASVNYTQKGVDLTLSYNQNGTDLKDMAVFTLDSATQKWKSVPGLQTIDPVKGTIRVRGLKSLASVLRTQGTSVAAVDGASGPSGLMAISDGHGYRPNTRVAAVTDTGTFAILRPSQVGGGSYSGTTVKIFNFPNPFNLQTKSVTLNTTGGVCSGAAGPTTTGGTVIKYEIPAGINGPGTIRIYTVSGRLVRELDAGTVVGGNCYYTQWDGRNRNGLPVANAVYYGIMSVGGSKLSSGTFKLAVIK